MDGEAEEAQPELHVALDHAEEKVEDIDRVRRHAWLGVRVTVRVRVRARAAGWMHGRASCEGHRAALPCCAPCRAWCSARIAVRCAVRYMVRYATEEGYYSYSYYYSHSHYYYSASTTLPKRAKNASRSMKYLLRNWSAGGSTKM